MLLSSILYIFVSIKDEQQKYNCVFDMGMTHERHVSLRTTCLRCFTPVKKRKKEMSKKRRRWWGGGGGRKTHVFPIEED